MPATALTDSIEPDVTASPEFKHWFGTSKVTDDDGKPQVVFHNTWNDFTVFDRMWSARRHGTLSFNNIGHWFSNHSDKVGGAGMYGPKQVAVYLSMQRPLVIHGHDYRTTGEDTAWRKFWSLWEKNTDPDSSPEKKHGMTVSDTVRIARRDPEGLRERLRKGGFDGLILRNTFADVPNSIERPQDMFIALESEQIKSATSNIGTFDPRNPDITASWRSDSQAAGQTIQALRDELSASPFAKLTEALELGGKLEIRNLPDDMDRDLQGQTLPDGKIILYAGNIAPGLGIPVLLHEAFHAGTRKLVDDGSHDLLMRRLSAKMQRYEKSTGNNHDFFEAANARVARARVLGGEMPARMTVEEFGAYAIEEYASAPRGIRRWVEDMAGVVKAWTLQRFGIQLGEVTPGELKALAVVSLVIMADRTPIVDDRHGPDAEEVETSFQPGMA